jgi:NADPH:quinone reductase-like Zn-dependent oxidoreductase
MRAVVQQRYGAPEQVLEIKEVDRPTPGPGEVLVRIRATSVNTPDWVGIAGVPSFIRLQEGLRPKSAIRGSDIAGVVEATGADVDGLRPGDEVMGTLWTSKLVTKGTFAEYTVAPAAQIIKKPAAVPFEDAAAAGMSALTALIAMRDVARVQSGTHVLINGASGGVGTFAVQLAKHYGAEVTGVCGAANVDLVRGLGADHVIDYTRSDFTAGTERYDAILDNVMNHPPSHAARALAPSGMLMPNSVGNRGGMTAGLGRMARAALLGLFRRANVRFVRGEYNRERLGVIAGLLESGDLRAVIDQAYPFEETPKAVTHMLGHHARGNIVITMP